MNDYYHRGNPPPKDDKPAENVLGSKSLGSTLNKSETSSKELDKIVETLIEERENMNTDTPLVNEIFEGQSEAYNIPYESPILPLQNPQIVSPIIPTTKYIEFIEFIAWLKGMCKAYYDMDNNTIPIEDIENKLEELEL